MEQDSLCYVAGLQSLQPLQACTEQEAKLSAEVPQSSDRWLASAAAWWSTATFQGGSHGADACGLSGGGSDL